MDDDATLQKEFSQDEVFLVVIGSERVCPMVTRGVTTRVTVVTSQVTVVTNKVTVVTTRVTVVTEQGVVWSVTELLQKGNFLSHLLYLILKLFVI